MKDAETSGMSSLVKCALAQLRRTNTKITWNRLGLELIKIHGRNCEHWQRFLAQQGHDLALLVHYLVYCLRTLKIMNLSCDIVFILQGYLQKSGGIPPKSLEQLVYFYHTNAIPTENLHLLQPCVAQTPMFCALCQQQTIAGEPMYVLPPCNHCFCSNSSTTFSATHFSPVSSNNNISCNVIQWLQASPFCPCCHEHVIVSSGSENIGAADNMELDKE